ncbi:MAG: acylphosphatase [Desulfurococcales archaeon]|nr:acylphosphatase [Desulfurococcales archaeon]
MGELIRAHIKVWGVVQGVFFRANMRRVAAQHGVKGWVRNLPDGRTVEAVLEGEREAVEKVICWAMRGPPLARVEGLQVEFEEYKGEFRDFTIRYF